MNRKIRVLMLLLFLLAGTSTWASMPKEWPYVTKTVNGLTIHVEYLGYGIIHVTKYPEGQKPTKQSYSVIMKPEDVWVHKNTNGETVDMGSGQLFVSVDGQTGRLTFKDNKGNVLLSETNAFVGDSIGQSWLLDADQDIFGMGQLRDAAMSLRGKQLTLWNNNMYIYIPYFTSDKGYGLYWDNVGRSRWSCPVSGQCGEVSFTSETGKCIDYYFMYTNGTQDGLIDCIRRLTGQATMFPLWTTGHWQCRERYKTSDELAEVLDRYRSLRIPLDGIVQDWQYWGCDSNWNAMAFQNPYYINKVGDPAWAKYLPDDLKKQAQAYKDKGLEPRLKTPQEMVEYVHQNNAHLMISIWANFGSWNEPYKELKQIGALLPFDTWPRNKGVLPYDPFNPEARAIYWKYLTHLQQMGFDAWWTDSSEPDHFERPGDDQVMTHDGEWRSVKQAFPLVHNRGIYENQRQKMAADKNEKRCVQMTRSGAFGEQHYGTFSWSGDILCSWDEMKQQIPSGLNFSLCGIPYWNTDIGGFFYHNYKNDPKNPALQEIHTRWMQWGTFMPLLRNHCSSPMVSELYHFGKAGDWAYDAQIDAIRLRYRLQPYIYAIAGEVTQHSGSVMRPLVMDFPKDKQAIRLTDEYLFGRALLVKPVTDPLFTKLNKDRSGSVIVPDVSKAVGHVQVYLPKGDTPNLRSNGKLRGSVPTTWYDFYTNKRYDGGQQLDVPVSIYSIPVFVRAGSILPFGPEVQYTGEKAWDDLEIRIYPGADGEFTLYEDEGDNYNYEKGKFSTIVFKWDDKLRKLTIYGRSGKFKGMLKKRSFRLVLVNEHSGRGDQPMSESRSIEYKGKQLSVDL